MLKPYRILVFGKPGCDKCAVLNQRIDTMLSAEEWRDFEKEYCDVETEEGLVHFASSECINPQQIPAMLLTRREEESESYVPIPNPHPGERDEVCCDSKLYQYVGLRTDYSDVGKGVISPAMITAVLDEARAH
jgi:hypothetical protein